MPQSLSRNTLNSIASRKHRWLPSSPNQGPELLEMKVPVQSPLLEKNMSPWAGIGLHMAILGKVLNSSNREVLTPRGASPILLPALDI